MNKYEISLDRINRRVEPSDDWTEEDWTHYKTVREALEKQIPKKPIINKRKIQCVNGHNQPTQHYKYCPMCGQLMDWSALPCVMI